MHVLVLTLYFPDVLLQEAYCTEMLQSGFDRTSSLPNGPEYRSKQVWSTKGVWAGWKLRCRS